MPKFSANAKLVYPLCSEMAAKGKDVTPSGHFLSGLVA